ncbi:MAG: stage III sporulation AC/AD family protein [Oscillospiraceae bacterium]|nr:stage III sporulation AC/AD family protein [Oscillospiraceae bacterium]
MSIAAVIGAGLIAAILCVLLRRERPEFALLLSLAAGAFVLFALFGEIADIIGRVRAMLTASIIPGEYLSVLLRAMGICLLTQIACDTCRDAGESAIAAKLEMAGKIAVLAVSLPLFEQVLAVARRLIQPNL